MAADCIFDAALVCLLDIDSINPRKKNTSSKAIKDSDYRKQKIICKRIGGVEQHHLPISVCSQEAVQQMFSLQEESSALYFHWRSSSAGFGN